MTGCRMCQAPLVHPRVQWQARCENRRKGVKNVRIVATPASLKLVKDAVVLVEITELGPEMLVRLDVRGCFGD